MYLYNKNIYNLRTNTSTSFEKASVIIDRLKKKYIQNHKKTLFYYKQIFKYRK